MARGQIKDDIGKIYWKTGQVAKLLNTEAYNIRFWEEEYQWLRAKKGKKGNRKFVQKQIDGFLEVQILLRNGMTAKGIIKAYEGDYFDKLVEFFKNEEIKEREGYGEGGAQLPSDYIEMKNVKIKL